MTAATSIREQMKTQMPLSRLLRAYVLEAKHDAIVTLKTPAIALPFLIIPAAIYLIFGIMIIPGGEDFSSGEFGPEIVNYLFAGFASIAVMMPGIFTPSTSLPLEREGGVLKLKRAQPMPPGANFIAKVTTSMLISAVALTSVFVLAIVAGSTTLSAGQLTTIWFALVIGSIPFCAIGFFIGSFTSSSASPAWGNLIFLPMMWLSGIFIPLPEFLQPWVVVWPAFHLDQLALGLAGVEQFVFVPVELSGAVLVGITVVLGGLALRRLARVG
jgi:ABC-2 type transport system permease protein